MSPRTSPKESAGRKPFPKPKGNPWSANITKIRKGCRSDCNQVQLPALLGAEEGWTTSRRSGLQARKCSPEETSKDASQVIARSNLQPDEFFPRCPDRWSLLLLPVPSPFRHLPVL